MRIQVHADALNLVGSRFITGVHRTRRISADDLDVGILFFEEARSARDSSPGANTGNEGSDAPGSVAPDLRSGSSVMSGGISGISILIGAPCSGYLFSKTIRNILVVVGRFVC